MRKPLISTIVFNSSKITNECFLKSLYKHTPEQDFDLLIVSTSDDEFVLSDENRVHKNISIINFKKKYGISSHAAAI